MIIDPVFFPYTTCHSPTQHGDQLTPYNHDTPRSLPLEWGPVRSSTQLGSVLARKCTTSLEVADSDKHSSLLRYGIKMAVRFHDKGLKVCVLVNVLAQ